MMAVPDRKVLKKVITDQMCGAGCSLSVQTIVNMLRALEKVHGDAFSIEGACSTLDHIATDAMAIKQ